MSQVDWSAVLGKLEKLIVSDEQVAERIGVRVGALRALRQLAHTLNLNSTTSPSTIT